MQLSITILITIPWFSPAYKAGGPIQSIANMVNQFSDNIFYKIFCSNTEFNGKTLDVPCDKWIVYNEITQVYYSSKTKVLKNSLNHDILFINGIYSWKYNLMPLVFYNAARKIVSARGMLHPGALSQKPLKKKIYLSIWKLLKLHKKCDFHASTEQEKIYIQNIFGKSIKVHIAQNFPKVFPLLPFPLKKINSLQLISIALISPMKNHLPVIKSLIYCTGNICYNIYGPIKDQEYWNTCLKEIEKLPSNIKVHYHGSIPPYEVENALSKNHIFILPSRSENFGHSIFEALSAGRPVITSYNTPWNNLNSSKAGMNINPESQKELADAINFFAEMNEMEFTDWSSRAKKYSSEAINVAEIKNQYRKMFFNE